MNESTEVTVGQVEACLALFKVAKLLIEELDAYDSYIDTSDLRAAVIDVSEQWDW